MGKAIIIPNVDFSNSGMGKVTIPSPPVTELTSIVIDIPYDARDFVGGPNDTFQLTVKYTPSNTTSTGVTWSIQQGNQYASITTSGVLSILEGANDNPVVLRATSTYDSEISATKIISVTYQQQLTLLQTALADTDVAPMMSNYDIKYQLDSEITRTGSETTGIPVTNPILSTSDSYFVLFDVTFGTGNGNRTAPCLFARLADSGNICKMTLDETYQDFNNWYFSTQFNSPNNIVPLDVNDGNRYKVFCCFNRSTSTIYVKNFTTGHTASNNQASGGGTIRPEVYLYGGTVSDNAFDGTIHDFIIGTL